MAGVRAAGALGLSACADPAAAGARFEALHRPTFEVWAAPLTPEAQHAALARAYAGEALTRAHVEVRAARHRLERAGARVEIEAVTYHPPAAARWTPGGVELFVDWTVDATVHHRGHAHPRRDRHRARVRLESGPEGPRIAALEPGRVDELGRDRADAGPGLDPAALLDAAGGAPSADDRAPAPGGPRG